MAAFGVITEGEELSGAGVYVLTGSDPDSGVRTAYIGEAEVLRARLPAHRQKDFWERVYVFVSKDENLTKAHVRYLEGQLLKLAEAADRSSLANSQGTISRLPESDRADMDVFLDKLCQLLPVLGSNLVVPKARASKEPAERLTCQIRKLVAHGQRTPDGFVVFEGSQAVLELRPSAPEVTKRLRIELQDSAQLVEIDGHLRFETDTFFSNPSAAAGVVQGGSANGLTQWRTETGATLGELESSGT